MQGKEQQEYREVIETMIAFGRLTEDDARKIYVMGADAVAFAILALQTKKQVQDKEEDKEEDRHEGSDKQSAPADNLSRPSATIPAYEKPNVSRLITSCYVDT